MFRDLLRRRGRVTGRARTCVRGGWKAAACTAGRAKALTLIVLLGAAPAGWSLGLGDIELDSALNEKLRAEIELINADGLQPTEIIVSLASAEDFQRVGVERFFFLTDLRFEVGYGPEGLGSIQVTSTQPVTEPYLNFLVEVLWPNGRLLREYTLLLDPPTFSPAPAPTVSAPSRAGQGTDDAGRVERPESGATATRGTQVGLTPGSRRQSSSSPLDEGVVDGEYRMTDRSDTLWSIATRTRPSQAVTVQQNMLAIQRLNPDAFLHDNINLLKAGYSLRLPSEAQALSTGNDEATRQVAMQNEDWRALRRGEPVPERGEERVAAAPAQARPDQAEPELQAQVDATPAEIAVKRDAPGSEGELRIVAGASDGGAAGASVVDAEEMNAALEEQHRLGREVEALTDELDREREIATNQLAVKDRQIEVKDQQIAEMQAQIERLREEMARVQATAPEQTQNQSASATPSWWQSPYALGGAAGAVVLLLAYGLVAARRRRAENDDFYREVAAQDAAAMEQPPTAVAAAPDEDLDEDRALAEEAGRREVVAPASAVPVGESTGSETGDVIGEADIYIAYGRYPQAIGLLLGVLEDSPERNDVRLKLLELYAETRDREAFDNHMAELLERCDDEEALLAARELGAQFGDEDEAGPAAGAAAAGEANLDLDDLSVDEGMLDVDADGDGEPLLRSAENAEPDAPPGAEDFELELDELAAEDGTNAEAAGAGRPGDALGGDLGLDFDPDREQNGSGVAHQPVNGASDAGADDDPAGEDDLDLDLDDGDVLGDDAFDFDDEGDTASTKLDLARAYIDMGDQDGARDILSEVVSEGNAEQRQRANAMLEEL